jgi:hypothetical protein
VTVLTLGEALATIRILAPNSFTLLGKKESGVVLLDALAESLYAHLHCRMPLESDAVPAFSSWAGTRDFVERLSEANGGTGTWQDGWTVRDVAPAGALVAERRGVRYWIGKEEYRSVGDPPPVGELVAVRLPKEYREMVPGFYLALGDADDVRETSPIVRVYWNVAARAAVALVEALTRGFNQAGIPFQLKVLTEPLRYDRVDPAVLYLPRADYSRSLPILAAVYHRLESWIRSPVSLMVKRVAPGVGVAEDPGDGSSYGEHRSRLLAGLVIEDRLGSLESLGYRLDALYLNPGSLDDFEAIAPHGD